MEENGPPALPSIPPNIAQLTTPILVGNLLNWFLFGILTTQIYVYAYSFPNDKFGIKILVWFTYMLELTQVCCASADLVYWFGYGFGNMLNLNMVYISSFDTPFMGSIVAFIVQIFFCYRIWKLRKNDWYIIVSLFIALVSISQLVGGIYGGIQVHLEKQLSAARGIDKLFAYLWLVGEAVADVLIAATMTYLLLGLKDCSMKSRSILIKIARLIVQSNALTASTAVVSVIFFGAIQGTNYFVASTVLLGKLYSNTLLATFNHRAFLRRSSEESLVIRPEIFLEESHYATSSAGRRAKGSSQRAYMKSASPHPIIEVDGQ